MRARNALMAQHFVTVQQLAQLVPLGVKTLYRMIADGTIPDSAVERARGRMLIRTSWIQDWVSGVHGYGRKTAE